MTIVKELNGLAEKMTGTNPKKTTDAMAVKYISDNYSGNAPIELFVESEPDARGGEITLNDDLIAKLDKICEDCKNNIFDEVVMRFPQQEYRERFMTKVVNMQYAEVQGTKTFSFWTFEEQSPNLYMCLYTYNIYANNTRHLEMHGHAIYED